MIRKVVVIGLDGLDPTLAETLLAAGELPALARMRNRGSYARLATTFPPQTPVAWSTFATGMNPGAHGIFDFLRRDPASYLPENGLFRYERRSSFLPPRAVNLRGGRPVWSVLADAGVQSVILRHPCTFPPDAFKGRLLAGVGVPDLRGGFGSTTWLTTDEGPTRAGPGDAEHVVRLVPSKGAGLSGHLPGPITTEGTESRFELTLEPDADGLVVCSRGAPQRLPLPEGEWSDWLRLKFKMGTLQSARGIVRFHLSLPEDPLGLHASPVGFDPEAPLFPISHPWSYAGELSRELGLYHTLGLAEDHGGLEAGRLDEAAFLAQCGTVMRERSAMLHRELDRLDAGLLFCLFDTPDRVQHMMWRFRESDHPANLEHGEDPELARAIEDHYRECDRLVGEVLGAVDDETLVIVVSDHGFTSFRRELHLNAWLREQGLLALLPGAALGEEDFLKSVDWSRTRAYALGLAGIYINRKGRESRGIVADRDAERLMEEIAGALTETRDPQAPGIPVRRVARAAHLYSGVRAHEAPDLVVGCGPGWRVSTASALGGVPTGVFGDNRRRWSGDHVVDPEVVPGVLFANRALRTEGPRLEDLAPTILAALGAPVPESMEGLSLLP